MIRLLGKLIAAVALAYAWRDVRERRARFDRLIKAAAQINGMEFQYIPAFKRESQRLDRISTATTFENDEHAYIDISKPYWGTIGGEPREAGWFDFAPLASASPNGPTPRRRPPIAIRPYALRSDNSTLSQPLQPTPLRAGLAGLNGCHSWTLGLG
jgi:hypothetical protein